VKWANCYLAHKCAFELLLAALVQKPSDEMLLVEKYSGEQLLAHKCAAGLLLAVLLQKPSDEMLLVEKYSGELLLDYICAITLYK
jgi:hypothetical protein